MWTVENHRIAPQWIILIHNDDDTNRILKKKHAVDLSLQSIILFGLSFDVFASESKLILNYYLTWQIQQFCCCGQLCSGHLMQYQCQWGGTAYTQHSTSTYTTIYIHTNNNCYFCFSIQKRIISQSFMYTHTHTHTYISERFVKFAYKIYFVFGIHRLHTLYILKWIIAVDNYHKFYTEPKAPKERSRRFWMDDNNNVKPKSNTKKKNNNNS